MYATTQTIWNKQLQTANLLGQDFTPLPNTTLNEIFKCGNPARTGTPILNMFTIGMLPPEFRNDEKASYFELMHSGLDAMLYQFIPFIMREIDDDLTSGEAVEYGLKTMVTISGTSYHAYYGKKLNIGNNPGTFMKVDKVDGMFELTDINMAKVNTSDIEPYESTPHTEFNSDAYLAYSRTILMSLDIGELEEIKKSMDLINPDQDAIIDEIGLVTSIGEDSAQLAFMTSVDIPIDEFIDQNKPVTRSISLGGLEILARGRGHNVD